MVNTTDLPRLLTATEVAAQFQGIKRHRLYELAKRGLIPSVRLGRALRFPLPQLLEWVEQGGCSESPIQSVAAEDVR